MYTDKTNIAKEIVKLCFGQKVKTQQQQNKRSNIKPLPEPGIDLSTARPPVLVFMIYASLA